jgi:hypothetical protein
MATSCASPTAPSSTRGSPPGQDRFPPCLLLTLQHPHRRTLRALQYPDSDGVLASARARREWNDVGPREPRDAPISEAKTTPTGERVTPEPWYPHGMHHDTTAYPSSTSTDVAAYEDLLGNHLLAVRNLIATTNDESYHGSASELPSHDLTWVCGVGLLQCAGPGDVPAVPRHCGLLVRLLR